MKWMAFANTLHAHPYSFDYTEFDDCLRHILRACGLETAIAP